MVGWFFKAGIVAFKKPETGTKRMGYSEIVLLGLKFR